MKFTAADEARDRSEVVDAGRRGLFGLLAVSPLLLIGLGSRPANAQAATCFDPAKLPMSDRSIRNSLGFKMQTPDPAKTCGNCAFYTATQGNCGKCQIFSNGPTVANAYCNSWAKKG